MQKLQLVLPTGWAMDALHKLISFGYGPGSVCRICWDVAGNRGAAGVTIRRSGSIDSERPGKAQSPAHRHS